MRTLVPVTAVNSKNLIRCPIPDLTNRTHNWKFQVFVRLFIRNIKWWKYWLGTTLYFIISGINQVITRRLQIASRIGLYWTDRNKFVSCFFSYVLISRYDLFHHNQLSFLEIKRRRKNETGEIKCVLFFLKGMRWILPSLFPLFAAVDE